MRNIQNHDVKIFTDNIETTAIEQIERLLTIPALQVTWETRLSPIL